MSKLVLVIFSLFGLINGSVAQGVVQEGYCDYSISVVEEFNVNAYLGVWYDIESLPSSFQDGACNTATYSLNSATSQLNVQNTQIKNGIMGYSIGTASAQAGAGTSAKFDVTFGSGAPPAPYWVLDTDYETFALVYSCRNITGENRKTVNSWKLGRKKGPLPIEATTKINEILEKVGLKDDTFVKRDHSEEACTYFADFEGPCPTVAGQADFDVERYLGTWYEVARYPQTAQTGQCNRAVYAASATDGVYSVLNSQVTNEALLTMSGEARATDQSGVLAVTFTVGGEVRNQNLHILATDYENYALAYSCADIGGGRHRIGSWELRKNFNPLSEESVNAINTAMADANLAKPLYQTTSQTSAACFFYPEFPPNPEVIELPGQCDTSITGVADFDVKKYLGTWYEVARYPQTAQTGQCNRAVYAAGATDGVYSVLNSQVTNEALLTISGEARATDQSGVLAVTFTVGGEVRNQNLHILATDYENYALAYSCTNIDGNKRRVGSWKLSKSLGPLSDQANNAINAVISETQGLRADLYQTTSQTSAACFYYPVFPPNPEVIEFSGQCDTSITGVADFDVERYLGTWYEVARYPQTAQTGQCNRAVYAVGATDGVYSVLNSQVTNEALLTMSGEARATDQSGVLAVTFTVGGEVRTENLHILATDYETYALAYSCINIDGNKRRVGSWKLSKSLGPLSDQANNAINAVISETQGLRADLYQTTSQTSAACFYYPVFPPNPEVIEFSGQCDTSITGVADFDVERYLGTWYEVARYPQTAQTGQCNRAVYAVGATDGVYSVLNSQVTNEALLTMSGEARATDQSGVLAVTFTVGGEVRTENLHILATDYETYALAYSCINIDGDKRRVGSWKLSKSLGPLSDQANNAINAVISETQGLRADLYQTTSQTSAACFYYPVFPENPDVIELPGQCDTSISGVADFDVNRYLGTWYEVARYPQTAQTGQCNRAVYAAGATDGVYSVLNSQVTNEALLTMSGEARATDQSGVLAVTFTVGGEVRTENLHILATDYETYALAYSCINIDGDKRRVGSWKLSKSLGPLSDQANNAINAVISETQGLRADLYQTTSQTSAACFYYPEIPENPVVIELPGQCDTSISGVADFDVNRYLGTWYEVARYPQTAQTGQCNRAVYAAGATDGVYSVQNSQVTNEALLTMSGEARATDQSGVLAVTFTVGGEVRTQNLHVLATDYESFALAYSCANINETTQRVGSWKLSRNLGPLSEEATIAINAAINKTQGLRPDLYQETQQTDNACWYYPVQSASLPVIIPGQCDTAISGVPNIDLTKFANGSVWYQISRYSPVGERSCIGDRLTLAGAYINVNSIELNGAEATRTEGIARLSVNETGKFDLELTDSDKVEIYVLRTDYDNYAIAYTCENEGATQRKIGVWLLSRTRTWPNAVNSTLQALINDRREITDRPGYFKPIPQQDDCPDPNSAFLFRSSIIVIFVCTVLQLVW
ncbi:hypothetical protein PYW07_007711 [Mythimna separata]|uniref:Lipocalin/cytosolic fatty-acid binding domain-containing protein n=1 Tax=Mythimna separata TaxID=271217 RepID=A0AAD7YNV9_MYTSE|nr:hypothetical protein PYW07_007711 [Mythimna separata]